MRKLPFIGVTVALVGSANALADPSDGVEPSPPSRPAPYAPPPMPPWRAPRYLPPPPPPVAPQQQPPPNVVPASVNAEVVLLHGTNNGTGIDPRIGRLPALIKPPFSAYNSYDLIRREAMPLHLNHATVTKLPNHGDLVVTFQGVAPQHAGETRKYVVNVSIQRRGATILPLLQVNAVAGETLFAAVPGYRGGVLVIGIRVI